MKIGIMAPADSGKSCYLTVLYNLLANVMSSKPAREHGLSYEWLDEVQRYVLERQYINLVRTDLNNEIRFPSKTNNIERHIVKIEHKKNDISEEIEFIDFPGSRLRGDLADSSITVTSKEVKDAMIECDGFIVLLDAKYLIKSETNRAALAATGRIISTIRKAVEIRKNSEKWKNSTIGVPVVLCISKFDLLFPQEQEVAYQGIMTTFQDIVDEESDHPVFITGISLGEDIENKGELNPSRLESTLEFCLAFGAFQERDFQYQQAVTAQKKQEEENKKIEETDEKIRKREGMSGGEAFGDWWTNGGTVKGWKREASGYYQAAYQQQQEKEAYEGNATASTLIGEEAARCLRDIDTEGIIYYHGKRHRFKKKIGAGFPLEEIEELVTL